MIGQITVLDELQNLIVREDVDGVAAEFALALPIEPRIAFLREVGGPGEDAPLECLVLPGRQQRVLGVSEEAALACVAAPPKFQMPVSSLSWR